MTSKLTRLTDDELTETLRQATSGYPLPASVEGNLRHAFAELQERRKAAMDSEPVFFIEVEGDDWINAGRIEGRNRPDLGLLPDGINYLYAAQPPVPELTATVEHLNASGYEYEGGEVTPQNVAAVVDMLLQQLDDAVQCRNAQPAPVVPKIATADDFGGLSIAKAYGWNACRAAMLQAGNSPVIPDCWCHTCRPVTMNDMRFVVCPECGNKRCPRANDHRNVCSGSNEPGQEGSAYPAAPHDTPALNSVQSVATVPDGYVMVPKEPTDEMIAAAMNCDDVLFNSDESFCVQFGNIYEAMLAAALQEVK